MVTGWRVEIHLKIPLPDDPPDDDPPAPAPEPNNGPSSDMHLRSLGEQDMGVMKESVDGRGRDALWHPSGTFLECERRYDGKEHNCLRRPEPESKPGTFGPDHPAKAVVWSGP